LRFEPLPEVAIPLSISVGAGIFPDDGGTLDAILIAADRRMYSDKTASRRLAERRQPASTDEPLLVGDEVAVAPAVVTTDPVTLQPPPPGPAH
jgi:hypothetical protein